MSHLLDAASQYDLEVLNAWHPAIFLDTDCDSSLSCCTGGDYDSEWGSYTELWDDLDSEYTERSEYSFEDSEGSEYGNEEGQNPFEYQISGLEITASDNEIRVRTSTYRTGSQTHFSSLTDRINYIDAEVETVRQSIAEMNQRAEARFAHMESHLAEIRSNLMHVGTQIQTQQEVLAEIGRGIQNAARMVFRLQAQIQPITLQARQVVVQTIKALLLPWVRQARRTAVIEYLHRAGILGVFVFFDDITQSELGHALDKYGLSFLFGWICDFGDGILRVNLLARGLGRRFAGDLKRVPLKMWNNYS